MESPPPPPIPVSLPPLIKGYQWKWYETPRPFECFSKDFFESFDTDEPRDPDFGRSYSQKRAQRRYIPGSEEAINREVKDASDAISTPEFAQNPEAEESLLRTRLVIMLSREGWTQAFLRSMSLWVLQTMAANRRIPEPASPRRSISEEPKFEDISSESSDDQPAEDLSAAERIRRAIEEQEAEEQRQRAAGAGPSSEAGPSSVTQSAAPEVRRPSNIVDAFDPDLPEPQVRQYRRRGGRSQRGRRGERGRGRGRFSFSEWFNSSNFDGGSSSRQ